MAFGSCLEDMAEKGNLVWDFERREREKPLPDYQKIEAVLYSLRRNAELMIE